MQSLYIVFETFEGILVYFSKFIHLWTIDELSKTWRRKVAIKLVDNLLSVTFDKNHIFCFCSSGMMYAIKLKDVLAKIDNASNNEEGDIFVSLLGAGDALSNQATVTDNTSSIPVLSLSEDDGVLLEESINFVAVYVSDLQFIAVKETNCCLEVLVYEKACMVENDKEIHPLYRVKLKDKSIVQQKYFNDGSACKPCLRIVGSNCQENEGACDMLLQKEIYNFWFGVDENLVNLQYLLIGLADGKVFAVPLYLKLAHEQKLTAKLLYETNSSIAALYCMNVEKKIESSNPFVQYINENNSPETMPVIVIITKNGDVIFIYARLEKKDIKFSEHRFEPLLGSCLVKDILYLSTRSGIVQMEVIIKECDEDVSYSPYSCAKVDQIYASGNGLCGVSQYYKVIPIKKQGALSEISGNLKDVLSNIHQASHKLYKLTSASEKLETIIVCLNTAVNLFLKQQEDRGLCSKCLLNEEAINCFSFVTHCLQGMKTSYNLHVEIHNNGKVAVPAGFVFSVSLETKVSYDYHSYVVSKSVILPEFKPTDKHSLVFLLTDEMVHQFSVSVQPVLTFSMKNIFTELDVSKPYNFLHDGIYNDVCIQMRKHEIGILHFLCDGKSCDQEQLETVKHIVDSVASHCDGVSKQKNQLSEVIRINQNDFSCCCWRTGQESTEIMILNQILAASNLCVKTATAHVKSARSDKATLFVSHDSGDIYELLIQTSSRSMLHDLVCAIAKHLQHGNIYFGGSRFSHEYMYGMSKDLEKIWSTCSSLLGKEEDDTTEAVLIKEYRKLRLLGGAW